MLEPAEEQKQEFVQKILDRAFALYKEGRFDSSDALLATLSEEPSVKPVVLHLRGLIALQFGQMARAEEYLVGTLSLEPSDPAAHANLGALLLATHRYPEAVAAYAAALSLDTSRAAWHLHLGLAKALTGLGMIDMAAEYCREASGQAPDDPDPQLHLALLLNHSGDAASASALLHDALARHPERPDLHKALAASLFAAGAYEAAWAQYAQSAAGPNSGAKLLPEGQPVWQGEDLAGTTILVHSNDRLSDLLLCAQYLPALKQRGAKVVLRGPVRLFPFLRSLAGIDAVTDLEDAIPSCDVHAPLLSLPHILGPSRETGLAKRPYLMPDPVLAESWREAFRQLAGLKIGLHWRAVLDGEDKLLGSMRIETLLPLLDCPGTHFVLLEPNLGQDQSELLANRLIDPRLPADPNFFAIAAAIIANLDLVISIDGAIAHLAGALGKPAFVMLSSFADWRWLATAKDHPWYPQLQLFRQRTSGDWCEVVAGVRAALWAFAGASPPQDASKPTPSSHPAANPILCDALFSEALRQHRELNLHRSKNLFEHVLALDPGHISSLCNLGALESRMGNHARALQLLEETVHRAPRLLEAYLALAEALLASGRGEAALAQYRKAIELAPKSDVAHAAFALALESLGHHETAIVHFQEAVKINQQQQPTCYEALGRTSIARANLEGAQICFKHALALEPKRAAAHTGLGQIALHLGHKADAIASFRRALDIDAHHAAAQQGLEQALLLAAKAGS